MRLSLTSRPVAAFPNVPAGRLPHSRFRGLLSVHSRCGPHGRWITLGDPLHRSASNDVVTSIIRSDCYRLERQFAGRDSHPLRDGAFPRWDHAPRTRTARAIWACRWSADAARLPLCIPTPSPARRRACSRLDNIEPVRFDSLTYACDASGIIALIAGSRHRHSRRPSSFRHRSTPEVPFLDRHYPASSVVRTSPPPRPAQPAPHGVPVGACHTTDRASRVAPIPLFHACRRQYPGGTSRCACRSLPGQWQPSPTYRRVGSRIPGFEACSAFTRVAARMVAHPRRPVTPKMLPRTMSLRSMRSAPIAYRALKLAENYF